MAGTGESFQSSQFGDALTLREDGRVKEVLRIGLKREHGGRVVEHRADPVLVEAAVGLLFSLRN